MRCNTMTPTSEICTEAKLLFIVQNYNVYMYRWNFPWLHDVRAKDKCIIWFKSNFGFHFTNHSTSDCTADVRRICIWWIVEGICRCLIEVLLQPAFPWKERGKPRRTRDSIWYTGRESKRSPTQSAVTLGCHNYTDRRYTCIWWCHRRVFPYKISKTTNLKQNISFVM